MKTPLTSDRNAFGLRLGRQGDPAASEYGERGRSVRRRGGESMPGRNRDGEVRCVDHEIVHRIFNARVEREPVQSVDRREPFGIHDRPGTFRRWRDVDPPRRDARLAVVHGTDLDHQPAAVRCDPSPVPFLDGRGGWSRRGERAHEVGELWTARSWSNQRGERRRVACVDGPLDPVHEPDNTVVLLLARLGPQRYGGREAEHDARDEGANSHGPYWVLDNENRELAPQVGDKVQRSIARVTGSSWQQKTGF